MPCSIAQKEATKKYINKNKDKWNDYQRTRYNNLDMETKDKMKNIFRKNYLARKEEISVKKKIKYYEETTINFVRKLFE
jgi:hypothetical protein